MKDLSDRGGSVEVIPTDIEYPAVIRSEYERVIANQTKSRGHRSTILVVTGHRPDKILSNRELAYSHNCHDRLTALAIATIERIGDVKLGLVGMAIGWDLAAAKAFNTLDIPYIACIPFLGQQGWWNPSDQALWQSLCDQAAEEVIVCEGGYTARKMQKRNQYMCDRANLEAMFFDKSNVQCLALWNGESGGTKNCLDYFGDRGKVTNVWGSWVKYNGLEIDQKPGNGQKKARVQRKQQKYAYPHHNTLHSAN